MYFVCLKFEGCTPPPTDHTFDGAACNLFSGNMQKAYSQLYNLNKDLMTGYKIRSNNHMHLLEGLKLVNQAIQRAGRLRGVCSGTEHTGASSSCDCALFVCLAVGKSKSRVVAACREAIKGNSMDELLRVVKHGASS